MSERIILPNDTIELEIVYGADKVTAYDKNQEPIGEPAFFQNGRLGIVERVLASYLVVGPGLHVPDGVNITAGNERSIKAVAKQLPREVVRYGTLHEEGVEDATNFVYFGNLAVKGRIANDTEIAAAKEEARQRKDEQERRRREAIVALDTGKTDYTEYDHVHIAIGDKEFFINFEFPQSILAYRVLRYLQNVTPGRFVYWDELDKTVWEEMPTTERTGLAINEAAVFHPTPKPIDKMTGQLAEELVGPLGLIDSKRNIRTNQPFTLTLHTIPNPNNYNDTALPIAPPNTPRVKLEALNSHLHTIPEEVLEEYSTQLHELMHDAVWSQKDAIDILDTIMSFEGKIALYTLLGQEERDALKLHAQSEETLANLHNRVRRVLGSIAYDSARRQRTIGGNRHYDSKHPYVKQTSGSLDKSETKKEDHIKRWAIGKPQTLKNRFSL